MKALHQVIIPPCFAVMLLLCCGPTGQHDPQTATQAMPSVGSELAAQKNLDKFNLDTSKIDWKVFVNGYKNTIFYSQHSGYETPDHHEKYEACKLISASQWGWIKKMKDDKWEAVAGVEFKCKNSKGKMFNISDGFTLPIEGDPANLLKEVLFSLFSTSTPFGPRTPKNILNAARIQMIAIGMTESQVFEVWGSPEDTSQTNYSWGTSGLWTYGPGSIRGRAHVYFSNGRVHSFSLR